MAKSRRDTTIYIASRGEPARSNLARAVMGDDPVFIDTHPIEIAAIDVARAAEIWAKRHANLVTSWPVQVRVDDPKGGIWLVRVEKMFVPEFSAGKPRRL